MFLCECFLLSNNFAKCVLYNLLVNLALRCRLKQQQQQKTLPPPPSVLRCQTPMHSRDTHVIHSVYHVMRISGSWPDWWTTRYFVHSFVCHVFVVRMTASVKTTPRKWIVKHFSNFTLDGVNIITSGNMRVDSRPRETVSSEEKVNNRTSTARMHCRTWGEKQLHMFNDSCPSCRNKPAV